MEMVPAAIVSNKTWKVKEWSQTTPPLHLLKPDRGLRLLDIQLQTVFVIEVGETTTNVTGAANVNVNVTLVNGETASEAESLPVVLAVTENGIMMDANSKTVVCMTVTTESVSNLFISPSFILDPFVFLFLVFFISAGHLFPPGVPKSSDFKRSVTLVHRAPSLFILQRKTDKKTSLRLHTLTSFSMN